MYSLKCVHVCVACKQRHLNYTWQSMQHSTIKVVLTVALYTIEHSIGCYICRRNLCRMMCFATERRQNNGLTEYRMNDFFSQLSTEKTTVQIQIRHGKFDWKHNNYLLTIMLYRRKSTVFRQILTEKHLTIENNNWPV